MTAPPYCKLYSYWLLLSHQSAIHPKNLRSRPPRTPPIFGISEQSEVFSHWKRRNMQESNESPQIDGTWCSSPKTVHVIEVPYFFLGLFRTARYNSTAPYIDLHHGET